MKRLEVTALSGQSVDPGGMRDVLSSTRSQQRQWQNSRLEERLGVIRRFRELLARDAEVLAREHANGRSLTEVLGSEILPLADACRFLERQGHSILQERKVGWRGRPWWLTGVRSRVIREPFGVVLIIAPSNYPLFLPGVQVLQSLTAGNAVLLKPGQGGLECALKLQRLLLESGLPEALLVVLPETPQAARDAIAAGPDKILFTGNWQTGTNVLLQASARLIPATLELSGCDAAYVREDADLKLAARAVAFGLCLNSGRTCISPKRLYVARSVATEFEGLLATELAGELRVRFSGSVAGVLAPLLREAMASGAHLLAGNVDADRVFGPLVVAGLGLDSELAGESFFAPMMCVFTVVGDEEALLRMNDNPYGLGSTVFTRDLERGHTLATGVKSGVVVLNDMIAPTADPRLPFGGRARSGFGVTRGAEGLSELTRPKTIVAREGGSTNHLKTPHPLHAELLASWITCAHGKGILAKLQGVRRLARALMRTRRELGNLSMRSE